MTLLSNPTFNPVLGLVANLSMTFITQKTGWHSQSMLDTILVTGSFYLGQGVTGSLIHHSKTLQKWVKDGSCMITPNTEAKKNKDSLDKLEKRITLNAVRLEKGIRVAAGLVTAFALFKLAHCQYPQPVSIKPVAAFCVIPTAFLLYENSLRK